MDDGYVYLIVEGDQYGEEKFKIGVTKNDPIKRLKKLRTGNSGELDILKTYRSKNYKKIEKILHKKFSGKKTLSRNEFFHLDDSDVIGFEKYCKDIDGMIDCMRDNPFFK